MMGDPGDGGSGDSGGGPDSGSASGSASAGAPAGSNDGPGTGGRNDFASRPPIVKRKPGVPFRILFGSHFNDGNGNIFPMPLVDKSGSPFPNDEAAFAFGIANSPKNAAKTALAEDKIRRENLAAKQKNSRRSSILTSGRESPLGLVNRPTARNADLLGG